MITKTFKEVHQELENESLFLQQNHNIKDFKSKADFLKDIGFQNSIATKIYSAISDNYSVIESYKQKYNGIYKFILKPQLERVCEKYNLYVRNPKFFLGDIPEKNIVDIMRFKVYIDDILNNDQQNKTPSPFGYDSVKTIDIKDFSKYGLNGLIEIAAVKSLFSDESFKVSKDRIIGLTEIEPKHQVDLDPIVLCRTLHGYIIITAWGDEANDELVLNVNNN